jgi:asparagine synthase (glutamine-hydrolysing)
MRLICGIVRLDGGAADERQLRAMAASMSRPAAVPKLGLWREGPAALAVLDFNPGATAEPLAQGQSVMVADVRLDEPDRVARSLGIAPVQEDRLLAETLWRSGRDGVAALAGDFAFASWDSSRGVLTCGRDAIGVRPFNYAHVPGRLFAFASLPAAIHEAGLIPKRLDVEGFANRAGYQRRDMSLLQGIDRLRPAHLLSVSAQGLSVERYWAIDRASLGRARDTPDMAAVKLRALIEEAVRCRIPSTGAVSAHLSGGLDSSAIAVIAARALRETGRRLRVYSFLDRQRHDVQLPDETEFVQEVLRQEPDIVWQAVRRSATRIAIPRLDPDHHSVTPDYAPEAQACRLARDRGVQLILSGWGGDEGASFSGRGAMAELLMRGRLPTLVREIRALMEAQGAGLLPTLRATIFNYLAPEWVSRALTRLTGRGPAAKAFTLQREFQGPKMRALFARSPQSRMLTWNARYNSLRMLEAGHIAGKCERWAREGSRHGIAYAFPLLDRRVLEYALTLPSDYFLKGGVARAVFRDAMKGILPEAIRHRPSKYNPFPSNPIDRADLKDLFLERLDVFEASDFIHQWVDLGNLRRAIEESPSADDLRAQMAGNATPANAQRAALAATQIMFCEMLLQHPPGEGSE